jgi:hypothetical protein
MRFPNQATIEDLKALVAARDDSSHPHHLSNHRCGDVYLHPVRPPHHVSHFREWVASSGAAHIFGTLAAGGGWVGPGAAADSSWMAELHAHLHQGWLLYTQACGDPSEIEPKV